MLDNTFSLKILYLSTLKVHFCYTISLQVEVDTFGNTTCFVSINVENQNRFSQRRFTATEALKWLILSFVLF